MVALSPACGCCQDCSIFEDDFDTDRLSEYDQRSGTWTVSGGLLRTGSANGLLIVNTPHPTNLPNIQVTFVANVQHTTDGVRAIVAYQDDDNYLYAQVDVFTGIPSRISLWERIATVDTQLGSYVDLVSVNPTNPFGVLACYDGFRFSATVFGSGADQQITELPSQVFTGPRAGVGTESVVVEATFEDLKLEKTESVVDPECPNCKTFFVCTDACENDQWPQFLRVTLTGIGATVDGTYVLESEATIDACSAAYILNSVLFPPGHCCIGGMPDPGFQRMVISVSASSLAGIQTLRVVVACANPVVAPGTGPETYTVEFEKGYGTDRIPCATLDAEDIPYQQGDLWECPVAGPTALVTAI